MTKRKMAQHNELGKLGEELAIQHLLKNDYKIIKQNYRYLKAEVDIIAEKENTIIGSRSKNKNF